MTKILNLGNGMLQIDDYIVEQKVYDVVRKMKQYDENLELLCLDPDRAEVLDAPYQIVELCRDGQYRRLFDVWELDDRVLDRIYAADTQKHDINARLDVVNEQARQNQLARYQESREEAKDIWKHIFASPKTSYTFPNTEGKVVKVEDG